MKTIKLIIVCALILFGSSLYSQRFIFRAGLALSTVSFTDDYEKGIKLGVSINAGYEIKLKSGFLLQPEIGFVSKGSDFSVSLEHRTLAINYLEFSSPVKFLISNRFHVLIGPTIDIGITGKVKATDVSKVHFEAYPENGFDQDYHAYIDNRVDCSLQFGAGVELWKRIIIDIRYTHGFTRLYTNFSTRSDFYNEPNKNAKNRSIQFTVGFPFSRKN